MSKILRILVIFLSVATATSQTRTAWTSVRPGVEFLDANFTDHGQTVSFVALRIDPRRNQVRIVDLFHEIGATNKFAAFSLRDVRKKTQAPIVVNAGSTASFSVPAPVGLLKTRGKVINPANYRAQNGGILCVMGDRILIVPVSSKIPNCGDAVQRGPLLSADTSGLDKSRFRRTVAAVDAKGNLLVLVTRDQATMGGIADFLYQSTPAMNIQTALNLDGDVSSGLIAPSDGTRKALEIGNVDGLIASAIAIYRK